MPDRTTWISRDYKFLRSLNIYIDEEPERFIEPPALAEVVQFAHGAEKILQ